MAPELSLKVLVDNCTITDRYFSGEPGLSFLIETEGKKILFDTGYSDLFLKNAQKLGENLLDLDFVILSHGHLDHTGGLPVLIQHMTTSIIHQIPVKVPLIVAHPYCFYPRPKSPVPNTGSILSEEELSRHFTVTQSAQPKWLTENLVFLGQIDRIFDFEESDPGKRTIIMKDGRIEKDLMLDDSALVFRASHGLVIITGCSHAGICNIVEHARKVCGDNRIIDIIGGLHLLTPNQQRIECTGRYLEHLQLHALHACHCTSLSSKIELARDTPLQEVGAGMTFGWG
jgi:7,8-dihydropterin-6-yl-methyl-4-(beta-D-ribofuranosyl)aminobenzene 5'-phosphate synthase